MVESRVRVVRLEVKASRTGVGIQGAARLQQASAGFSRGVVDACCQRITRSDASAEHLARESICDWLLQGKSQEAWLNYYYPDA